MKARLLDYWTGYWGRAAPRGLRRYGLPETAYHEAGHALAGYLVGWRCRFATVRPNGVSRGRVGFTHLWPIDISPWFSEARRIEATEQLRRQAAGEVLVCLAGVTAEAIRAEVDVWRFFRPDRFEHQGDCRRAGEQLQRLWSSLTKRTEPLPEPRRLNAIYCGLRLTERMLLPNRAALYALADELMQRETLRRRKVDELICKHARQLDCAPIDPSAFFRPCIDV